MSGAGPLLSLMLPLLLMLPQFSSAAISSQGAAANSAGAATAAETRLLDSFNHRYPDGSYEYRFELSDGTARYERGYFALVDQVQTLMVVGYYSYRMPDARYITVFYNADQFGFRQNQSITPQVYPNLPRSIDVPAFNATTAKRQQPDKPTRTSSSSTRPTATPTQSTQSTAALPTRKSRF